MPKVFVSIVNFNGENNTLACLDSLNAINVKGFDLGVVVIDNNSKEVFALGSNAYKFPPKIIRSEKNLGFSGGQNLGIKYALEQGANYVVILNNDVILDKDLFIELLKTFEEKRDCGLVSPKIYFAKGYEFHKERYKENDLGNVIWYAGGKMDWNNVIGSHRGVDKVDKGQYKKVEETDFASGCCEMVERKVFEKIGLFDEKYFLYYEDSDLSQRAKLNGFGIYYQPKAVLWHLNAGSTGGSGSFLHDYYITRNRLLFGLRYSPLRSKLALFRESIKLMFLGRHWQRMGVVDFYLANYGRGSFSYE